MKEQVHAIIYWHSQAAFFACFFDLLDYIFDCPFSQARMVATRRNRKGIENFGEVAEGQARVVVEEPGVFAELRFDLSRIHEHDFGEERRNEPQRMHFGPLYSRVLCQLELLC